MTAKLPQPPTTNLSLKGLVSWGQTLVKALTPLVGNSSSVGTPSGTGSGSTVSMTSFVPLTFKGTPLVFVTDASGNLIFVGFNGDD